MPRFLTPTVTVSEVEAAISKYGLPTSVDSLEDATMHGQEATAHAVTDKYGAQIGIAYLAGLVKVDIIDDSPDTVSTTDDDAFAVRDVNGNVRKGHTHMHCALPSSEHGHYHYCVLEPEDCDEYTCFGELPNGDRDFREVPDEKHDTSLAGLGEIPW